MTTDIHAATGAAEQTAPELNENEIAEVVDSGVIDDTGHEAESSDAKPVEKTAEQKELERLRRQLTKRDRTQGKLHQELQAERQAREAAEQRALARTEHQQDGGDEPIKRQGLTQDEFDKAVQERAKNIARVEKLNAQANTIYSQGAKKFTDFDASIKAVNEEVPLFDPSGPTALMEAVLDSDTPETSAALLHYLGNNPDITAGLEGLTAAQISRRLVRIEMDMKEAAKPKISSAPPPLKPVNTTAATADPDPLKDFKAWSAARNAKLSKR